MLSHAERTDSRMANRRRALAAAICLALGLALAPMASGNARQPHEGWHDGVVYYHFELSSASPGTSTGALIINNSNCWEFDPVGGKCSNMEEAVREAIERIEMATPVEFVEVSGPCPVPRGDFECLEIRGNPNFAPSGNATELKTNARGPGVMVHELTHSLGFGHEHMRADVNRWIDTFPQCTRGTFGELPPPPDEERVLLGPGEFGGFEAPSTLADRALPWKAQPTGTSSERPASIMIYSGHKGGSPFQDCFEACPGVLNGDECSDDVEAVERPWEYDDDWRQWPCDGGWGEGTLPPNVRGCADDATALAECNTCEQTYGELHLMSEQKGAFDDERARITEHRWYYTWFDRGKVSRRHMDMDVDDLLRIADDPDDGWKFTSYEQAGQGLDWEDRYAYPSWDPAPVIVPGYFNGDYYSDLLLYDPSDGSTRIEMTPWNGDLVTMPTHGELGPGWDIVLAGWFETGTHRLHLHLYDQYQDLFVYDRSARRARLGRFDYHDASRRWRYADICEEPNVGRWDHAVVGDFAQKQWVSQVVFGRRELPVGLPGGGKTRPLYRLEVRTPGKTCLEKIHSQPAPRGAWTHLISLHLNRLNLGGQLNCADLTDPDCGDRYSDLLLYDTNSGEFVTLVSRKAPGLRVEFEPVAAGGDPFPAGAEQVVAADLDNDDSDEVLLYDADTQTLTVMKGQHGSFSLLGTVVDAGPDGGWGRIVAGQFPDGVRPASEHMCGNGLIEGSEFCDTSAVSGECPPGMVPHCALTCDGYECRPLPLGSR